MKQARATPRIVALSILLYRALLRVGPRDYRLEYEVQTLQVLRQCCLDAYRQSGRSGVLLLWLPLFKDAALGMLAEQLSTERVKAMLPTLRRSMLIIFGAFLLFALAFVAFQQIVDPRAPFTQAAQSHFDLYLAFSAIVYGGELAFLAIVVGGVIVLGAAVKLALAQHRRDVLIRFGLAALLVLLFVGVTLVLQSAGLITGNQNGLFQLAYLSAFLAVLVAASALLAQGILRTEFSPALLRFALIPMLITTLAMGVSFLGIIVWTLRLWADAPALATRYGLGPDLAGGPGGSFGVAVVLVIMVLTTAMAGIALGRGIRGRWVTPA